MTKKDLVLDCLIDDAECFTQIKEFFDYCNVKISSAELYTLLDEMISEGLLFINTQWMNEKNEYPFALTALGKLRWKDIKE